ncbi:MAG: MBL fold metallo-hydrolase [Candidatus Magasanikbacteria bacterium]|nr:MBL fold metallo-hydrolase [Candidatus Magasanikbacteria bacterium]
MKISFFGAAHEVTGSCSLFEHRDIRILVDCGAFQGGDFVEERNADPFVFDAKTLSAVVVTHAHLDHIGRLPLLIKAGYDGFIYATPPTVELLKLVLEDAVEVMTYNNKKFGTPILYNLDDVAATVGHCKNVEYYEEFTLPLSEKVAIKYYEAGHIFGSAFVEIRCGGKKIIFSGDLGNVKVPILRDTDNLPGDVDLLVCESTYGDRLHDTRADRQEVIKEVVKRALDRGGVLMVPAFSVERTQEILYDLNEMIDLEKSFPQDIPIFLDSPLAIEATEVFNRHTKYFDEEAKKYLFSGDDLFHFRGLKICYSRDESKKINSTPGRKIIIAGAGMMNGGRIQHHALRYLSDEKNTLFFTGFQAPNTLGRKILDGASSVSFLGERVRVKCKIEFVDVLSAHADRARLFNWIKNNGELPKKVILNHGDLVQSQAFADRVKSELSIEIDVASPEMAVEF